MPLPSIERSFLINLRERTDRRAELGAQLERIGLDPTGDSVEWFDAVRPDGPGAFRSIGSRGCFLSHLGVLTRAVDEGLGRIAILEDDLDFAPDFEARRATIAAALDACDWEFFYGGWEVSEEGASHSAEPLSDPSAERRTRGPGDERDERSERATAPFVPEPRDGEPLAPVPRDLELLTTHFVCLRGDAIERARDHLAAMLERPVGDPAGGPMDIDGAYNWLRRTGPPLDARMAVPALGHQRSSRSDIAPKWWDRVPGLAGLASRWRARGRG